jgi:hypothetical protein
VTDAMTPPAPATTRSTDLGLARVHLRLGSLAIARAELETLAGRDALDEEGLLDLAEVRWRTGDIVGAGEAADAILRDADGRGPLLAVVIAAEASMARGRPTEARRLADQVLAADRASVDRLFAGMPRSAVWPADPVALPPSGMTLFDPAAIGGTGGAGAPADPTTSAAPTAALEPAAPGTPATPVAPANAAGSIGLWEAGSEGADGVTGSGDQGVPEEDEPVPDLPPAGQALADGRTAIVGGRFDEAAVRLGLALRLDPSVAPAVLELLADTNAPELALTRGDAYRLLGREAEARRAYAGAMQPASSTAGGDDTPTTEPPPEPETESETEPHT